MRRRLGIATSFEGPDTHGHSSLTTNAAGRLNARHTCWNVAWRQVFSEAGSQVPDRNWERMLSRTHIRVPPGDTRRLDLVVPGLSVAHGLPLFCDATCVFPIGVNGLARSGATNVDGGIVERAARDNDRTYREVTSSGLARLCCLGVEVYGRWSADVLELVPAMAWASADGLPQRVRAGTALALQRRWFGILGVAVQRALARGVLTQFGADLPESFAEHPPEVADLPASGN